MAYKTIEIPPASSRPPLNGAVDDQQAFGSPAAILAVMKSLPPVEPAAVDELEAAIRLGKMTPRFAGEFD